MSDIRLDGKVALITGAGSRGGLGRAMTSALVKAGARVAMVDVDAASLDDGAAEMRQAGGNDCVTTIVADATVFADAERAVRQTIDSLGGLQVLINNAGINPRFSFWELPPDAWIKTIAVNVTGPFLMAKAAAPHLRQQGWGRIVGVTTSLDTMLATMPYGPSKAGHEAFMSVLAKELEGTGVTANVLVPGGAVDTAMTQGLGYDANALLRPEVMQDPIVWLASNESDGFHGQRIIARRWDESLPIDKRLEACAAPIAWPQLGRPSQER
ncbi:MAG TPA: SDR family oxidoreductase [Chloroflexota bacterium]|nr:SDR family oxidoreductase [Chloroflexota bacterium]